MLRICSRRTKRIRASRTQPRPRRQRNGKQVGRVQEFRNALDRDGVLRALLNRFTQATMVQVAQNVVCNRSHTTESRMARWLATTHDRVGRDEFPLTQQFLAQMLGVDRPAVSQTAQRIQAEGLIRYSRGTITIVDREELERAVCECYGIIRAEFDALRNQRR